jgi:hypothetical protein
VGRVTASDRRVPDLGAGSVFFRFLFGVHGTGSEVVSACIQEAVVIRGQHLRVA